MTTHILDVRGQLGRKFEIDDQQAFDLALSNEARTWLETYVGDFGFVTSLKEQTEEKHSLTRKQYVGLLNCIVRDANVEKRFSQGSLTDPAKTTTPVVTLDLTGPLASSHAEPEAIPPGFYTAVFEDETHRTLRIQPHWDDAEAERGSTVVGLLGGPNNSNDYINFAFQDKRGQLHLWKRFRDGSAGNAPDAFRIISKRGAAESGYEYSLKSSRCYRCGRVLTVPASIHRGLGPICAEGG